MKKVLFTFLVIASMVGFTNAQGNMKIGAGVEFGLPIGDWSDIASTGIGGTARFEMDFAPSVTGTARIGYISWGGKDFGGASYSISSVPIRVGVKYGFPGTGGLYGKGELGIDIFSTEFESDFNFNVNKSNGAQQTAQVNRFSSSTSSSEFAFMIALGYMLSMQSFILDFNAGFNVVSDANYLGISAAALFPL